MAKTVASLLFVFSSLAAFAGSGGKGLFLGGKGPSAPVLLDPNVPGGCAEAALQVGEREALLANGYQILDFVTTDPTHLRCLLKRCSGEAVQVPNQFAPGFDQLTPIYRDARGQCVRR